MKNVECFDAICAFSDSCLAKEEKTGAYVATCTELAYICTSDMPTPVCIL